MSTDMLALEQSAAELQAALHRVVDATVSTLLAYARASLKKSVEPLTAEEPTMTAAEAGAYLQLHATTVRDFAYRGLIAHSKVGSLYRFRKSDLDAYLTSTRTEV